MNKLKNRIPLVEPLLLVMTCVGGMLLLNVLDDRRPPPR